MFRNKIVTISQKARDSEWKPIVVNAKTHYWRKAMKYLLGPYSLKKLNLMEINNFIWIWF